jgi:hypothetical protein
MFTSINMLRNSSAMQDRVTSVEKHLKRLNPDWDPSWWFPVLAIGLSNVTADVEWVHDVDSTHLKNRRVYIGATYRQSPSVLAVVEEVSMVIPYQGKTAFIEEQLRKYNERIGHLFNIPNYVWHQNPLTDKATAEATAEQAEAKAVIDALPVVEELSKFEKAIALEEQARAAFVQLNISMDWKMDLAGMTPTGKFANDRAEAKFKGFVMAIEAFRANPMLQASFGS